jgi:hypothetical protein
MDEEQHQHFQTAVDRKKEQSKAASEHPRRDNGDKGGLQAEQTSLIERGRPQETRDPRAKNEAHRKKTADKWNQ